MVLPCASVMVMVVLLNDEFTCAMPEAMFLRSRRRTRVASLPIDYLSCDLKRRRNASGYTRAAPWQARPKIRNARLLLLAGDRLGRTLARARVGVGALAAHRQAATMAQAAIAAEVHQTLDVDADLAAQVALDEIVAVDHFADLQHFLVAELADAAIQRDLHLLHDLAGVPLADAMDVLKRDQHALVGRDVDAGDTGHGILSCHRHEAGISNCVSSGRCPHTRTRLPNPLVSRGPASSDNYPIWMRGLLRDESGFRQPILTLSSLFRDLFDRFCAPRSPLRLGRPGQPPCGLFGPPRGVLDGFGGLFGCLGGAGRPGGGLLGGHLGLGGADGGQNPVNLPGHLLDGHHAVDGQELPALRIIVD